MEHNKNISYWNFDNSYIDLSPKLYKKQLPDIVKNPFLVCFNSSLAKEIGLSYLSENQIEAVEYLSGNKVPKGSMSIAQAYAGHQFGHFTMLGDGRAILLGEQINTKQERFDIQLKGSGRTPYSRNGDGRATLSSMLREYIISESMYHLGVPTTRSLAVVKTDNKVIRESVHQGGVLSRIASSHIRIGTFEYIIKFCSKEELVELFQYVVNRHYPIINESNNPPINLLKIVMHKLIDLIIDWFRVGFIHGVMNTDNMSIAGETMDYGPCAFMNIYNPSTVFSSIDRNGRYAFKNQATIARWNLAIFAQTLLPLISENKNKAIQLAQDVLNKFSDEYSNRWYSMMFKKIGIIYPDKKYMKLVDVLLKLMEKYKADYTNSFAALSIASIPENNLFQSIEFNKWYKQWMSVIRSQGDISVALSLMKTQNPLVIPRNHLVELALDNANKGNNKDFDDLLKIVSDPYHYSPNNIKYQTVPSGYDDSYQTFCGT